MDTFDKFVDIWKHHPQNHMVKGMVFLFTGIIGIGAVIILFYTSRIPSRTSTKLVPPTSMSPTPETDISISTPFVSYVDETLQAQFSYASHWVTKTEGDRKDWRVIVSDQQQQYFAVQFRRIENNIYSVDEYIRLQFRQFPEIQVSDYEVSGIHYRMVTGDLGITMYYLYTSQDNGIYEIAILSSVKDKSNKSIVRNLKLAEMTIRSFIFQSTVDMYKIKVDLQQIRAVLEMYYLDNNGTYPRVLSQLVPRYMQHIHTNPVSTQEYAYSLTTPYNYLIETYLPDGSYYSVTNP